MDLSPPLIMAQVSEIATLFTVDMEFCRRSLLVLIFGQFI